MSEDIDSCIQDSLLCLWTGPSLSANQKFYFHEDPYYDAHAGFIVIFLTYLLASLNGSS